MILTGCETSNLLHLINKYINQVCGSKMTQVCLSLHLFRNWFWWKISNYIEMFLIKIL